jgi:hypothetical protein
VEEVAAPLLAEVGADQVVGGAEIVESGRDDARRRAPERAVAHHEALVLRGSLRRAGSRRSRTRQERDQKPRSLSHPRPRGHSTPLRGRARRRYGASPERPAGSARTELCRHAGLGNRHPGSETRPPPVAMVDEGAGVAL